MRELEERSGAKRLGRIFEGRKGRYGLLSLRKCSDGEGERKAGSENVEKRES